MLGVTQAGTDSRPDGPRHEPPHDERPGPRLVVARTTRHADRIRSPVLAKPGGRIGPCRHPPSPTAVGREPAPGAGATWARPGTQGLAHQRHLGDEGDAAHLGGTARRITAMASRTVAQASWTERLHCAGTAAVHHDLTLNGSSCRMPSATCEASPPHRSARCRVPTRGRSISRRTALPAQSWCAA